MKQNPNLWKRSREELYATTDYCARDTTFKQCFSMLDFNAFVDTHTKTAALRVSPSLVSLISYSGDEKFFMASGIIVQCDTDHGTFVSTIFTSASLLRINACDNSIAENLKVEVILPNGNLCLGNLSNYDLHFNLCAIEIQTSEPMPTANLKCLDDSIESSDTSSSSRHYLRQHSNLLRLLPGDDFIALGRYHSQPYDLMVAPGKFSIDRCGLDCKELLRVNSRITRCGIGGPLINLYGEVVGINFYVEEAFTPFLPMNVVCKWWEHAKCGREYHQSWIGIQGIRLFEANMDDLKKIVLKSPNISRGIFVEEVALNSPAARVGICPNDVIVRFGGTDVRSLLELFEKSSGKIGKSVDVTVMRASSGAHEDLSIIVARSKKRQMNRWPLPDEYEINVRYAFDMRLGPIERRTNLWRRDYGSSVIVGMEPHQQYSEMGSFDYSFSSLYCNQYFDIFVKRISMKAARSVVSIKISYGGKEVFGSGFAIEFDTIITSATLLSMIDTQLNNLKVVLILYDGTKCNGVIEACDHHWNVAAIRIRGDKVLEIARLTNLDDFIQIDPTSGTDKLLETSSPHIFRMVPGDRLIALGRSPKHHNNKLMVSPGEFSVEQCRFECKELLRSTGRITQCGIGGPMINHNAEVIGVNFFDLRFTPFLPINIVSKWWNHYKKFGDYRRPCLGIELSNLFTIEVNIWEEIIQKFPNIKSGVLVDEVSLNSSSDLAGVHPKDIIVECDGVFVQSSLQLIDLIWDKVGKSMEFGLFRLSDGSYQKTRVMVVDATSSQFNRWPVRGHC